MIRKATLTDKDFIFGLYMHPAVNPYLLYEPMDMVTFEPIVADLLRKEMLFIYQNPDGLAVGMFKLVPHTYRSAHIVYLGGVAVDPQYSGKGYGFKMMQHIIAFTKDKGFLRVELSVAIQNEKAISLYEKVGFEKEGTLKKYTYLQQKNIFIDEILMAYIM